MLIFSQFKIMLNVLEDYLRLSGYPFERIDGDVKSRDRQNAIDRFSKGALHAGTGSVLGWILQPSTASECQPDTLPPKSSASMLACMMLSVKLCGRDGGQLRVPVVDTGRRAGHHAHRSRHVHHLRQRLQPSGVASGPLCAPPCLSKSKPCDSQLWH